MIKKEIEQFLDKHWGEYAEVHTKKNFHIKSVSYSKHLINVPTILMVVKSPIDFDPIHSSYGELKGEPIRFFLHDKETGITFGCISEIPMDEDWRKELVYRLYTVEHRLKSSECPECGFWLVQRSNQHGHEFMGCCGFPDCDYSAEIRDIYDDEI